MKNIDDEADVVWFVGENGLCETIISKTEADGTVWWVPVDEGNRHYQEYLEWVAEGNTPGVAGQ